MKEEVRGPRMSHTGQPSTPEIAGTRFSGEGSDRSEEGLVGRCEQGGQEAREEAAAFINSSQFRRQPPALGGSSQSQGTAFNTVFEKTGPDLGPYPNPGTPAGVPSAQVGGQATPTFPWSPFCPMNRPPFSCLTLVSAVSSA